MKNYIHISFEEVNFNTRDNKNSKLSFEGKKILKESLNLTVEEFNKKVKKNKYGKPIINNEQTFFNISHSNNVVVVGLSDKNIGIDIEYIRQFDFKNMKNHFLTTNEYRYICTKKNKLIEYFKMWTIKEALLKLLGVGLTIEPCNIEIDTNTFSKAIFNNRCFNVINMIYRNYVFSIVTESHNFDTT